MIKLIAIDLDGTTLDPERKITKNVKAAIQAAKEAGIKVVVCSGRPLMGVLPILEELNLREAGDLVITYNGALVQKADTGEEFIKKVIASDDFLDIDCAARKVKLPMMALTKDGIYTSQRDIGKYVVHEASLMNMPLYYRLPEEIAELEIVKCMMVDEEEKLDNAIAYLPFELFDQLSLTKSSPFFLEILNPEASKGNAVLHLAKKLYLDKEELMAIGDSGNDQSMLEVVGNPVAMGNATNSIKKIAKYMTKSNAEDGVAYAINQWALKKEKK